MTVSTRTEKEKMLTGEPYLPGDPQLCKERFACAAALNEYHAIPIEDGDGRFAKLQKLFGAVGVDTVINPGFRCDYGYNIKVGRGFFANHNVVILDCAAVTVGDNVLIGPGTVISTATHPLTGKARREKANVYSLPVTIGNDVFIGANVTICPGVKIGNNVNIAAGAVVAKDLADNGTYGGVPAKRIADVAAEEA